MLLESVKIKNIRSIRNVSLEFPPTTMLFYGDIGAGKSSVLKGIEFALFGVLPSADLAGFSLLRRGEEKGSVELTFSIDDASYTIKRYLNRNKKGTIAQSKDSYIIEGGEKTKYTTKAMRQKILTILNYSVTRYENAKKIPLFRYTVYTPQEQVKEILNADPEERFEILKEVFGIEKYETALKNVDLLKDYLNRKMREFNGRVSQIGTPETVIPQREREIESKKVLITDLEQQVEGKAEQIAKEETEVEKLQTEINDYNSKLKEINRKEREIKDAKDAKDRHSKELERLDQDITGSEKELEKIPSIIIKSKFSEQELKQKIKEVREKISQHDKDKAVINQKIEDIDDLLKKGTCSLCGQKIHEKERFESEKKEITVKIEKLSTNISTLTEKLNNFDANISKLRESLQNKNKRDSMESLIEEKKKRRTDLQKLVNELDKDKHLISSILKEFDIKDLNEFKKQGQEISRKYQDQKAKHQQVKMGKDNLDKQILMEKKDIEHLENMINELKDLITLKKELDQNIKYMNNLKNFSANEFPNLIREIEKKILAASARQFNEYFKEWFKTLVDVENIEVEIRPEDFQPTINVNGHESPFNDLSGGEKSALSLAYRLSLNKIINERYQEITTKDLLILDEPTDGFSQQQINRMQGIFTKLNMGQMIIISHERTLDSFVTDLFEFKKENHETVIGKGKSELASKPVFTSLNCPACDASLDISGKDDKVIVCSYCKKPFLVERGYD